MPVGIRDRLAEIKNHVGAIDRVPGTLGHQGDLDSAMPRQNRQVLFGRGELTRAILDELRGAKEPLGSREIARAILLANEQDPRDRRLLTEDTRGVSKAPRKLRGEGLVKGAQDARGNMVWTRAIAEIARLALLEA